MKYQVIEAKLWRRDDGATASIYGACPWTSPAEKPRWKMVSTGWTVKNPLTGQIGVGKAPCATKEDAEALVTKLGTPSRIGIGD